MPATAQQIAFTNALVNTRDNLALVARAGTGKTTTILQGVDALRAAFPRDEIVVCAYNKAIADEVAIKLEKNGHITKWTEVDGKRIPPRVTAATLHSLGFSLIRTVFRDVKIEENKVRNIVDEVALKSNSHVWREYSSQICQLVSYAKGAGFGFFNDLQIGDTRAWYQLADHYDVNGLDDTSEMDAIVEASQWVYRKSLEMTDQIDFDDMILWPLVKNIVVKWGKDHIFLDEAQDLSRARQALAKKFIKRGTGRMYIVGDDRQAIYGFSGADDAALENLVRSLNAKTMPLTLTWRCPKSVVRLAQELVPDIEAPESAIEGEVLYTPELPDDLCNEDAILCRNTAPLISTAYKLIRKGVPCKVEGRAIGQGLEKLVTRWKVKTIDALLNRLEVYREREVQKAVAKGSEAKANEVNDKCDTLKEICEAVLGKGGNTVHEVKQFIEELFDDQVTGVLTLATYHRSKGREWPRVILVEHATRCPSRAARQPWQLTQEENLAYVAFTRAQRTLVFWN